MTRRAARCLGLPVLILLMFTLAACDAPEDGFVQKEEGAEWIDPGEPIDRDLAAIRERDTLTVLAAYNTTSYFLYRGEPMGYEYELLKQFAEDQDLAFETVVVRDRDSLLYLLNQGAGDIAAARLVPMAVEEAGVAFTESLYDTRPAVVQRSGPPDAANLPAPVDSALKGHDQTATLDVEEETAAGEEADLRVRLVTQPSQLAGQEIYAPSDPVYQDRLVELSDSLTGDIYIVEADGEVATEELIRRVSAGEIALTLSQENLAELKETYYTNVTVRPVLGPEHHVAWAVRKNAPELKAALDAWIAEHQGGALFNQLYTKYFVDRRGYQERVASRYLTSETGQLSPYDDLLKKYAPEIGWDWRLLASQTYQESRFKPTARSWAGAVGLLQLMPATAREFGVTNARDPEDNVAGAVRFLDWLTDYWDEKIADPEERLRFILASYNTGAGHVGDAQRLAEKNGDDPTRWDDVAFWLLQKSKRQYYTDPVVKYGFCRGLEPVTYVGKILDRYQHYRQFVDPEQEAEAPMQAQAEEQEVRDEG